jgi:hypothetical protein
MADISDMVPDVRAEIPEIPGFVAERQLLRSIREFCAATQAWRVNVQISTTADVETIDIEALLPTATELIDVISMKNVAGGQPVLPKTHAWLDENTTDWHTDTDLNAKYYIQQDLNELRLSPIPSVTTAFQYDVRLSVKPTLAATEASDILVSRYNEIFIHGALAKLYLLPRKPWSDTNLSAYHMSQFTGSFFRATAEAADEFQKGVARTVKYGGI